MFNEQMRDDDRKTYYVNVQSGQLYEQSDIAPYHVVIHANPLERNAIMNQFHEIENTDERTLSMMFFHLRNNSPDISMVNSEHDYRLQTLYRMLHKLGTDETKKHIEEMGIM